MLEISDIILTSILKGLKRKPTLLVHFLFATILATILKILVKLIVNYFVNYFHISPSNYQVVLSGAILTGILMLSALELYIHLWNNIRSFLYENLYKKSPEESLLK